MSDFGREENWSDLCNSSFPTIEWTCRSWQCRVIEMTRKADGSSHFTPSTRPLVLSSMGAVKIRCLQYEQTFYFWRKIPFIDFSSSVFTAFMSLIYVLYVSLFIFTSFFHPLTSLSALSEALICCSTVYLWLQNDTLKYLVLSKKVLTGKLSPEALSCVCVYVWAYVHCIRGGKRSL